MKQIKQPDILIFLSDQHDGRVMGCAGHPVVQTPHMDALAADGTMFEQAYTPCPLCVPARMSMLTGRLPIHTGVYTNHGSIHPEMPTFLHSLALAGYETVLCGRMHFEGSDQRHGFTKRIAWDITPTAIGAAKDHREVMGAVAPTMTEAGCIHVIGGGNSMTLEYDRYVVGAALEYFSKPHEKPQCIIVGTYGPHFPYVAPEELYEKYLPLTPLPPTLDIPVSTPDSKRMRDTNPQIVKSVQAAYWGMVEFEDECLGIVRNAWDQYLTENERNGIFVYTSDHGDHAGDRGFYGKQSLLESAVRIPMIAAGSGIQAGQRLKSPVSLLDLSSTLCELAAAAPLPVQDGISLAEELKEGLEHPDRQVIAEWINLPYMKGTDYGRMIRQGEWKLISYSKYPEEEQLTLPEEDPWELHNYRDEYPQIADCLRLAAYHGVNADQIVEYKNQREDNYLLIEEFNKQNEAENLEMWPINEAARTLPKHYLSTANPMPPRFQKYWDMRQKK